MQIPRMTTRRWMIVVVVVGLVMVVVRLNRRHRSFRDRAAEYALMERGYRGLALGAPRADWLQEAALYEGYAAYYAEMSRKYRHAARFPWLHVEPDPPRPER